MMDDLKIKAMDAHSKKHLIYDVLYGFIQLSPLEWEIIQSPFFQRLRWIKQLGFSFFTFPGAEHSRFGHSRLGPFQRRPIPLRMHAGAAPCIHWARVADEGGRSQGTGRSSRRQGRWLGV